MSDTIEIYENEDSDKIVFEYNINKFSDNIKFFHQMQMIRKMYLDGSYIKVEITDNTAFRCTQFDRDGSTLDKFVQHQLH